LRLDRVRLRFLTMRLTAPFVTSFGSQSERRFLLVEAEMDGVVGLGEVTTFAAPLYNEEFTDGAFLVLRDYLVPALLGREIAHPSEVTERLGFVRRHHMAKAGLEGAIWDAFAKAEGRPLWQALGGERRPIPVGVSIGIQDSPEALAETASRFAAQGYQRLKLKIEPGRDIAYVAAVRRALPEARIMADANSAYRLGDWEHLRRLDELNLMMLEQPLSYDDIFEHAELRRHLATPICLDESIHTPEDAALAIRLGSCRIINIKVGRVGGLESVRRMASIAHAADIPVWCGGMLESGIGRAHNIALASLPGFTLPGDPSGSDRYWHKDITTPPVTVAPDGTIALPDGPGIGYEPDWAEIERVTETIHPFSA
jgi:O-succinylbenzoate synthase